MKKLLTAAIVIVFLSVMGYAAIPGKISHQGRLTNSQGVPLSGSYKMEFRIYTALTGGTLKWSEIQNPVSVTNGVFMVIMGSNTTIGTDVFDGTDRYLEIWVNDEALSPRITLTSSPHAYVSENAYNIVGSTINTITGKVGILTTSPSSLLDINGGSITVRGAGAGIQVNGQGLFTGNVGIGTLIPSTSLEVMGTAFVNGSSGDPGYWFRKADAGITNLYWGILDTNVGANANQLSILNNSAMTISGASVKMTILENGNIGIGTTNPAQKLAVAGGFSITNGSDVYEFGTNGKFSLRGPNVEILFNSRYNGDWFYISKSSSSSPFMFRRFDYDASGNVSGVVSLMALENTGVLKTKGAMQASSLDLAEVFEVNNTDLEEGDVVVMDETSPEKLKKSCKKEDSTVVGIVCTNPGMILNKIQDDDWMKPIPDTNKMVALVGRVPCKVCDENGPIHIGDMLTTSSTPGYAMRASPIIISGKEIYQTATIIGKSMGILESGQGMITVFILK
jgi:hypothetical protein